MGKYTLKLYINGYTALANNAIKNLNIIFEREAIKKKWTKKIINLAVHPEKAEQENILATPVIIKDNPKPRMRVVGDLSNYEEVITALDLEIQDSSHDK